MDLSPLINLLNNFALNHPWILTVVTSYLLLVKTITAIRDSFDKTPQTDDNWFERTATILGKTIGALSGIRPKAPDDAKPVSGASADAVGVKVEEKK